MNNFIVMESASNIRKPGREALKGHWMEAVLTILIASVIVEIPQIILNSVLGVQNVAINDLSVYVSQTSSLAGIYSLLITGPICYGVSFFFLKMFRNYDTEISMVLSGFAKFGKTFLLSLYISLFVFLWSLLFIIPGIIAAIRYSQSFFIMVDNPDMSIPDIVNESKRIMVGNKGSYFYLSLTFLGWALLAAIPIGLIINFSFITDSYFINAISAFVCGVGLFWVYSYIITAYAAFYDILTGRLRADTYNPKEF